MVNSSGTINIPIISSHFRETPAPGRGLGLSRLLVLLGLALFLVFQTGPVPAEEGPCMDDIGISWSAGKCRGQGPATLTWLPLDLDNVDFFIPLGTMDPKSGHVLPANHSYFFFREKEVAWPPPFKVRAPADGYVVRIQRQEYKGTAAGSDQDPGDYNIYMEHSCTFLTYLIHVNQLSAEIRLALGGELAEGDSAQIRVPVAAGQVVGWAGAWHQVDFGVVDTQRENFFITPDRYNCNETNYMQDPFDYLDPALARLLETKNRRSVPPLGGTNAYDRPGRLSGNWFLEGHYYYDGRDDRSVPYYYSHLAFGWNCIDPNLPEFAFSQAFPLNDRFGVTSAGTRPDLVTPDSGFQKYALVDSPGWEVEGYDPDLKEVRATLAVEMLGPDRVRVEQFRGQLPDGVAGFTSQALVFER